MSAKEKGGRERERDRQTDGGKKSARRRKTERVFNLTQEINLSCKMYYFVINKDVFIGMAG